jgi:hypothetical protein
MFKYSDTGTKGPFKIGRSVDIHRRMNDTRRECEKTPIVIDDPQQRLIQHVFMAEKLIFVLLRNHRRRIRTCAGCERGHIEWFDIDEASALRVIEKVRQFMEDRYGHISPQHVITRSTRTGQTRFLQLVEMAKQLERRGTIITPGTRSSAQDIQRGGYVPVSGRVPSLREFLQALEVEPTHRTYSASVAVVREFLNYFSAQSSNGQDIRRVDRERQDVA